MDYAYGRVSAKDQNLDRQIAAFEKIPIKSKYIYTDKQSGSTFERAAYQTLIKKVKPGDLLYIKSIDRLGRNYEEILEQWKYLTKEKRIDIVVLDMPLLDTRYAKNLIGTFLADVVLQLLSFVAENERTISKERQAEGIKIAKQKKVKFGRPRRMSGTDFKEKFKELSEEGYNRTEILKRMDISVSTFYRYLKEYGTK